MTLSANGPRATVYTSLGQTLRVPLTAAPGLAPENQLITWFNRQMAANPAFPMRVRSILLVVDGAPCGSCGQGLRRFLARWNLSRRLRVVTENPVPTGAPAAACTCQQAPGQQAAAPPQSELEALLGEAGEAELVGPYRRVRGHHIHQSGSYGRGDARTTNPNHQAAIAIQQGVKGFTEAQHNRASAVQRAVNRAYHGRDVQEQAGNVRVSSSGTGTLAPTPNQGFEDMKAYYALIAAGKTPDEAYRLTMQSAQQLAATGTTPQRIPSR